MIENINIFVTFKIKICSVDKNVTYNISVLKPLFDNEIVVLCSKLIILIIETSYEY
jgi:hypothetical protein